VWRATPLAFAQHPRRVSGWCCRPAGGRPRPPCATVAVAPPASRLADTGSCDRTPLEPIRAGEWSAALPRTPINPSAWRRAKRKTARRVSAIRVARGEYQGCPPGVVRGVARHSLVGEPHREAPALTQAGVVLMPVPHLALLLGNMMAAVMVQLERQGGRSGIREERSSYVGRACSATGQDSCNSADSYPKRRSLTWVSWVR
jgi:hypothetical protein